MFKKADVLTRPTPSALKCAGGKAAASEEVRRTILAYVEPLRDVRTKLEGFFIVR